MASKKAVRAERAVVICTDKKGVFFGYTSLTDDEIVDAKLGVTLGRARMCVYWSAQTKGVLGLAATGPASGSRVGPCVPTLRLVGITAVMGASDEAAKRFEEGPWS